MTRRFLITGVCLLLSLSGMAQEGYLTLSGRVTDCESREGLPAVTVYLAGQPIYTQTNNDGEYVLKVPKEFRDGSVVYALMGYRHDTVGMATAQRNPDVALTSDGGRWLKEVTVKEYSPKAVARLLQDVVNRIPQNYQTDSVVGTWFYRDVRMLDGELFLFDEMVFDALRVGYDKHHKLKRLMNAKGPYGSLKIDYKRPIESNYTCIRHDRLLLCDTAYVRRETKGLGEIDYKENEVLYDPVEVPNTTARLAIRNLKKAKDYRMYETSDAEGREYYVAVKGYEVGETSKIKIRDTVRITIEKKTLAITRYEETSYFMMKPYFPLKKMFAEAGVDSVARTEHVVYNYGMVEGKYTLTSYTRNEGYDLYYTKDSPMGERMQRLEKRRQCVLTSEHKEGSTFLKNNVIQAPGSVLVTQRRADNKQYDEAFWQQYNYIPVEAAVRKQLDKKT